MLYNFIAYFRKGGDFLKSYWAKWPRKQAAFFHCQTIKGAESNIFTCKPRSIFKTVRLSRLSRVLSSLRSRRLQVLGAIENGRAPGRHTRGEGAPSPLACLLLAHPFFLPPTTFKRLLRRLYSLLHGPRAQQIPKLSRANCVTIQLTVSHEPGKQCAWSVSYPLYCFSLGSLAGPPSKRDYLESSHSRSRHHNTGVPANQASSVVI